MRTSRFPHTIERLPNGLTLVTAAAPQMASVSVGLWVATGGRYEPAELNGVSHFIEHMLFKGTRRRSARHISEDVEGLGGYLNAFTSEENTCFYAKAPAQHFPAVLDVLADMFLHSRFAPADIEKERAVIKEEWAMYKDQPQHYVQELLNAALWPGHPLGRPLTGTNRSVDAITRRAMLRYRELHYVAPAVVLAVAGHFSPTEVRREVERASRRFRPGARSSFAPATWRQREPVVRVVGRKTEQAQVALGVRTTSRHDEARFALRLLNTLLGENMSSRLFQVVREDSGLAYSIGSSTSFFADAGDLVVSAGLELENLERVLRLTLREMRRLRAKPAGTAELRRAKDYVIGQIDLSLENTESRMTWVGEQYLGYGHIQSPAWVKRQIAAVTRDAIRHAADLFFRPERLTLAVVSPRRRATGLAEILARVGDR